MWGVVAGQGLTLPWTPGSLVKGGLQSSIERLWGALCLYSSAELLSASAVLCLCTFSPALTSLSLLLPLLSPSALPSCCWARFCWQNVLPFASLPPLHSPPEMLLLMTTCSLSRVLPASHLGQHLPLLSFLRAARGLTFCPHLLRVQSGAAPLEGVLGRLAQDVCCHLEKVLKMILQPDVPWSMAGCVWMGLSKLAATGDSVRKASAQPKLSLGFWCQVAGTSMVQNMLLCGPRLSKDVLPPPASPAGSSEPSLWSPLPGTTCGSVGGVVSWLVLH